MQRLPRERGGAIATRFWIAAGHSGADVWFLRWRLNVVVLGRCNLSQPRDFRPKHAHSHPQVATSWRCRSGIFEQFRNRSLQHLDVA